MPRITKAFLEQENARLIAELNACRERSRSRKRKIHVDAAPMMSASRRALDLVRKHDRDGVIEDQRKTIARQAQELAAKNARIEALERGAGPIGKVLRAAHDMPGFPHDEMWSRIERERTESVKDFVKAMWQATNELSNLTFIGRTLSFR